MRIRYGSHFVYLCIKSCHHERSPCSCALPVPLLR